MPVAPHRPAADLRAPRRRQVVQPLGFERRGKLGLGSEENGDGHHAAPQMRMTQCKRKRTGDRAVRDSESRKTAREPPVDDAIQHARRDPAGSGARGSSDHIHRRREPAAGAELSPSAPARHRRARRPAAPRSRRRRQGGALRRRQRALRRAVLGLRARRHRAGAARARRHGRAPAQALGGVRAARARLGLHRRDLARALRFVRRERRRGRSTPPGCAPVRSFPARSRSTASPAGRIRPSPIASPSSSIRRARPAIPRACC